MSEIRIGALATLAGPFAEMGKDGFRGLDLAIDEFGGEIAGQKLTVIKQGTNAMPEDAEALADMLIEQENIDFLIGPLSGNEGLAVKEYARTRPQNTFINGAAGAQDMTLRDPAPNFFSFLTNGVQWMYGLVEFVYQVQGHKRIATLAEDYSFPYSQVGAFTLLFCRMGGKVIQRFWVPLGTTDYSAVIASMPDDIDAILVALGGTDSVNFLKQYDQMGGRKPLIGGTITVDQSVLSTRGALSERLIGMASCSPIADSNPAPAWQRFVQTYHERFPKGLSSPSLFAYAYYTNTKAALLALQRVDGDLSDGQQRFQNVLMALTFQTPTGTVRLDHNRQAIGNNFITVVSKKDDGSLYNRLVKVVPEVTQTLGIPEDEYLKIGSFSRDNPPLCP